MRAGCFPWTWAGGVASGGVTFGIAACGVAAPSGVALAACAGGGGAATAMLTGAPTKAV